MARYLHTNFNVRDLEKSIAFYEKALGLKETRRVYGPDGAFTIVFMGDGATDALLELTSPPALRPGGRGVPHCLSGGG